MESHNLLEGNRFIKLQQKAKELGAKSLEYSKRKNSKYVTLSNGKQIHFGSPSYQDFLIHKDKNRRDNYLQRATAIRNKKGELTYNNPESSNYWAVNLLWM